MGGQTLHQWAVQAFKRVGGKLSTRAPYWTDVRTISNTPAARAVILIPVLGYWIIFNDHLVELAALSRALISRTPDAPPTVPWRLFASYFGLCLVAVASMLYQWRCPTEVKLHPTATEYVGSYFPHISGIEEMRVEHALASGDEASKRMLAEAKKVLEWKAPRSTEEVNELHDKITRNVLQAHFDLCNRSFPKTRLAVGWCYWLGLAVLAVPACDIFVRVCGVLVHKIGTAFVAV